MGERNLLGIDVSFGRRSASVLGGEPLYILYSGFISWEKNFENCLKIDFAWQKDCRNPVATHTNIAWAWECDLVAWEQD